MFVPISQLKHPLLTQTQTIFNHLEMMTIAVSSSRTLLQFNQPVYLAPAHKKALLIFTEEVTTPSTYQFAFLDQAILLSKGTFFNILPLDTPQCTIALGLQELEKPTLHPVEEYTNQLSAYPFNFRLSHLHWISKKSTFNEKKESFHIYVCLEGEYHLQFDQSLNEYLYPLQLYICPASSLTITPLKTGRLLMIECQAELNHLFLPFKNVITLNQKQLFSSFQHQWNETTYAYLYQWAYTLFLDQLLIGNNQEVPSSTSMKNNAQHELFLAMRDYLLADLKHRHQVQHLVDAFELSRSTIQTIFLNQAKTTPVDYINRLRIEESQRLMKESTLNLTQISQQLGFKTLSYFSRAFTKQVGMSPSNYAKTIHQ